jgi:hypothetical protein
MGELGEVSYISTSQIILRSNILDLASLLFILSFFFRIKKA